jgi:hypothetical protein
MLGGQSTAADSASRGRTLTGTPLTESNLNLRAAAQRAADMDGCGLVEESPRDRPDGLILAAPSSRSTAADNPIAR